MSDYERTLSIDAPAEAVFAYVSDLSKFGEYLKTVTGAEQKSGQTILLRGNAGQDYEITCTLKVDAATHEMAWSYEGGRDYSGTLRVERGDVAEAFSEVTVRLSFGAIPVSDVPTEMDERILASIDETLQTVRKHVEHAHKGQKANFL